MKADMFTLNVCFLLLRLTGGQAGWAVSYETNSLSSVFVEGIEFLVHVCECNVYFYYVLCVHRHIYVCFCVCALARTGDAATAGQQTPCQNCFSCGSWFCLCQSRLSALSCPLP